MENDMKTIRPSPLLKFALVIDAVVTGAVAVLQLSLPQFLADLLVLPRMLLLGTGAFLVAYTVLLVILANSKSVWRAIIELVIVGNVGWAIGCVVLLIAGFVVPSGLGIAFVAVQAVAVLVFAGLEFAGLKSSLPTAAPGSATI
jgi:hypothetical protein